MAKMNRPAESWSRLATDLAVMMGSRCGMSAMPVPSLRVRVGRRGKRQRHERIMRVRVALGQLAAARERRAAADRDVRMLAHEQRFEAARLECARQLVDGDAVIRRK